MGRWRSLILVSTDGGTNGVSAGSAAIIEDNTWHHLAFVWKSNTIFATYLDGVLQNSRVASNVYLPYLEGISGTIGSLNGSSEFMQGNIDEVRIWNVARSEAQINSAKNFELQGNESGLKAYYKFNQGFNGVENSGTNTLTNAVIGGSNGTLNNFALTNLSSNWLEGSPVVTGIVPPYAPTAVAQSFCNTATVSDLVAEGTALKWYDVESSGTPLETATVLTTKNYYVSQTVDGNESARTGVSVTLIQLGTPVSTATIGNPGSLFYVNVPITSSTSNLTYQWQKFSNDSWEDILDAQATPSSSIIAESGVLGTVTDYRLKVSNTVTGGICYSATLSYTVGLVYCDASSLDTSDIRILNFAFADINNSSTSLSGYEDFTSLSTNVIRGEEYAFSISTPVLEEPTMADGYIWIDYNHNGEFDAEERTYGWYASPNGIISNQITIPSDALLGPTRMRVRLKAAFFASTQPCGNGDYGQVEDYTVNIIACPIGVYTGVTSSDWHTASNWCGNEVPVASSNVIVATSNPLVISSDVTIASLTLGANANFTVNATLDVGDITVATGGQLIVANDAVVLQTESATNTGLVTVKRNSVPLFRQDYTLWSSPVFEPNLRNFSPQTLYNRFFTYGYETSESGAYLQELFTASDVTNKKFTLGKGYLIRMPNDATEYLAQATPESFEGVFTGNLNNGTITFPLIGKVLGTSSGLNLVGNPYPSPISIANFFATNTNIVQTLYFWKKLASADPENTSSGYATLNTLGFTSTDPNLPIPTLIQTGQAFFVTTTNETPGNLVFNNSMRTDATSTFFKTATSVNDKHRLWLNLSNENKIIGQTLIGYAAGATQGIDTGWDALYFNDSPTALTSLIENKEFIIQTKSLPFVNTDIVPLGFKTNIAGSFTISLSNFDGLFASNQDIFLKDKFTNTVQNLKTAAYTFTAPVGVFNNRFEVQYDSVLGTNNPNLGTNTILIGVKNQQIKINAGTVMMEKIELIDLSGRVLYTLENVNSTLATIENVVSSNQMLIVRISTKENGVVNQKIIF